LHPIPTDCVFVEHGGVRFLVRVVQHLTRKDVALQQQRNAEAATGVVVNPFLPYDEALFVADISPTHLCLLNKFNVIDHHLLIVTRAFEEQESLLTVQDFAALWACMAEIDGLAFYNAGTLAGASQRHKHLQLVPLPLAPEGPKVPIAPAITAARFTGPCGTVPAFPFLHAIARVEQHWHARDLFACYHTLLRAVGLLGAERRVQAGPPAYNLLATRQWMLLVPRAYEQCEAISVNALGFAGALLVRDTEQLAWLTAYGPMCVLQRVAVAVDAIEGLC
jgi:ATP adenylyltransferase